MLFSFFFYGYAPHRDLHSFPTRRSSDLGRAYHRLARQPRPGAQRSRGHSRQRIFRCAADPPGGETRDRDRKSTRLNSSHTVISYAVFCLKKKKKKKT